MARTRTLLQMRTEARELADIQASTHISDAELTRYINRSIAHLYGELVNMRGDAYYLTTSAITTTANQATDALPSDFFKAYAIDVDMGGASKSSAKPLEIVDRNLFSSTGGWTPYGGIYYRIEGANIRWYPTPGGAYSVTLWYVPCATQLSADGDTFDGINGFEDWVILDSAIRCMLKEESDTTAVERERERVWQRIKNNATYRDAGGPPKIQNTARRAAFGEWEG